jgi:hypothetical protein
MVQYLLDTMRKLDVPPNNVTYGSVFAALGKAGEASHIDALMSSQHVPVDASTYNAIISGCASRRKAATRGAARERAGDAIVAPGTFALCERYFKAMVAAGHKPDTMTFSNLIVASKDGSEGAAERAQQLLDSMKVSSSSLVSQQ